MNNQDSISLLIEQYNLQVLNEDTTGIVTIIIFAFLLIAIIVIAFQAYYMEDTIKKRTRDITSKNHQLETVSFIFAHDLRGAADDLDFVMGYIGDAKGKEKDDLIKMGKLASQQQSLLLEGAYEWSKVISTSKDIKMEKFNITEYMKKHLPKDVIVSDLGIVKCNKNLFYNVLTNLVKNGRHHNDKEISIIKIYREGNEIIIQDNGNGMTAEQIIKMLQPFQKNDSSKGLGLGLAITKAILDLHDFGLRVESKVGVGSKFIIELI